MIAIQTSALEHLVTSEDARDDHYHDHDHDHDDGIDEGEAAVDSDSVQASPVVVQEQSSAAFLLEEEEEDDQEEPDVDVDVDVDACSEQGQDTEERLARSRDRNREHARRTRLRKKQQLDVLQNKVKELQDESRLLKQTIEECSIASILLGLSTGLGEAKDSDDDLDVEGIESIRMASSGKDKTFFTITGKRKRFVSDADLNPAPMQLKIKGKMTLVGGSNSKAQINWKTGVYLDDAGEQQQLTANELEELR